MPPEPSAAQRADVEAQRRAYVDAQVAEAVPLIEAIAGRSCEVRKRVSLSWFDLHRKKPSSEQYQYIKQHLDAAQRTQVASALEEMMVGRTALPAGMRLGEAVAVWNSIQHTRLRVHDAGEARNLRLESALGTYVVAPMGGAATLGVLLPVPLMANHARRKNYYRSESRPEYGQAFNAIMRMLSCPDVAQEHKCAIAGMFLDQHIREEETIPVDERNQILRGIGLRTGAGRRVMPARGVGDLQERLIEFVTNMGLRHQMRQERLTALQSRGGPPLQGGADAARAAAEVRQALPLHMNVRAVFEAANQYQRAHGLTAFAMPEGIEQYDHEHNADAFSAVLQRVTNPPAYMYLAAHADKQMTPELRQQLALQGVKIVRSLENREVRSKVFDGSVGGTVQCNNNTLDLYSRLGKCAAESLMVEDIAKGNVTPKDAARMAIQFSRQHAVETILETKFFRTRRGKSALRNDLAPEVILSIKSKLKTVLDLPDNIAQLDALYWRPNFGELRSVIRHVKKMEHGAAADVGRTDFYLNETPSWRRAVIAMVERSNPEDAMMLHAFNRPDLFEEPVAGSRVLVHRNTQTRLQHEGALQALRAHDALSKLEIPDDDQESQVLREAFNNQFKALQSALIDVEVQLAAHVSPSLLVPAHARPSKFALLKFTPGIAVRPDGRLPEDGAFNPTFRLPADWDAQMERLEALALPLDISSANKRKKEGQTLVKQAQDEIAELLKSYPDLPKDSIDYAVQEDLKRYFRYVPSEDQAILKPEGHDARLKTLNEDQQGQWRAALLALRRPTLQLRQGQTAVATNTEKLAQLLARAGTADPAPVVPAGKGKGRAVDG